MDTLMQRIKNRFLFLKRDAKLEKRIHDDYIDNGIATLPAKVSGTDDIISHYSVAGYETLNPEFSDYIESYAAFIPAGYPIVLELSGCQFSADQQEMIRKAIQENYLYSLGAVQKENRRQFRFAALMMILMLITGVFTFYVQDLASSVIEILYIFFWFFADLVACYCFMDGFENRKKRLLAGRLASMTVNFSPEYDDSVITDEEAQAVYREIRKEANET